LSLLQLATKRIGDGHEAIVCARVSGGNGGQAAGQRRIRVDGRSSRNYGDYSSILHAAT
jgi:hypothetical protein